MKTLSELDEELNKNGYKPNAIPRKEYDELLDNIEYIISPKTGKPIKPNTFSNIYYPWQVCRGVDRLSRETLVDLFLVKLDTPIKYKDRKSLVMHTLPEELYYCD